jgi:hypothetical protein
MSQGRRRRLQIVAAGFDSLGARHLAQRCSRRYIAAMTDHPRQLSDLTGFTSLDEFGVMPREEKLEATLANPQLPGAMKLGTVKAITKARIRHQFANLLSAEFPHMQEALGELRAENPKVYLDQIMGLAEFAIPKLKSVEVEREGDSERAAKEMTMTELMNALMAPEDDPVVSEQ